MSFSRVQRTLSYIGTEAQRGYIPDIKDLNQVSYLLVWTGGFLAIFLFYASEMNSPPATHCTKWEALRPCCSIKSPGELWRMWCQAPPQTFWFSWLEVGPLAKVFLKSCPGDGRRHAELRTRPKEMPVLGRSSRRWTQEWNGR